MKFPSYIQPDSMDCGPTCLRMVSAYYGKNFPLQFLREKTQIGREGVNLLGISEAAEAIGFRTQAVKLSLHTLVQEAALPAILHWGQSHFVVLYKVKRNNFLIADPAKGKLKLTQEEFTRFWVSTKEENQPAGIALLLEPTPAFYTQENITDHEAESQLKFGNIFSYLIPYRKLLVQLGLGLGAGTILQLLLPFLTQSVVDTGINNSNIQFIYIILLAQLALLTGRMMIEFIRGWILLYISTRINISILIDFLIKLMRLPINYFDSKHTGDILQRMNDHRRIESFLTSASLNTLFSFLNLIVFSVVLLIYSRLIFFVFIVAALLYSGWMIFFLRKRKVLDYQKFKLNAREQGQTIQLIQGMQEIRLYGAEKQMRWTWERLQTQIFGLNTKTLALNQWQQAGAFLINEGKNIFITFLSAKAVVDGDMTLGSMLAVQYIIGQLNSPIDRLIQFLQSMQDARISMDRLNEIHSLQDEEPASGHLLQTLPASLQKNISGGRNNAVAIDLPNPSTRLDSTMYSPDHAHPKSPSISINNLNFTYTGTGNQSALTDINVEIPIGKCTAIVGGSGSGKTTLLKLLLKFYRPNSGEIKIATTSLENISHKAWRGHCGVVMQDSYIFSDTIARNIAIGTDRIEVERLERAAKLANIHEFIETLPLRYNSKIGADGIGISMGQKQRILIARAIYRDPDFIFFDEATNSLDATNESDIVKNLRDFFKGKTVLIIAHRLSTVRNADQIIVLDKGRVVETGTHIELLNLHGKYFELVSSQMEINKS